MVGNPACDLPIRDLPSRDPEAPLGAERLKKE